MHARDWKVLDEFVADTARELALAPWQITVSRDGCADDDELGTMTITINSRTAVLAVCKNFRERSPDIQRATIVHELLHCHLAGIQSLVDDMRDAIGPMHGSLLEKIATREIELAIDGLEAIAKRFPYIKWTNG